MTRPFFAENGQGKVWFIGAGPGAPDLITVRGQRLIRAADLVLYAGSLVPASLLEDAGCESAVSVRIIDSSSLTLDETHALCRDTALGGGLVARVHTGDPSLYGALREQSRLLDQDGVAWGVVPGVTAAFAAAAAAGVSLTAPDITQTVILTRMEGRTPIPERERLRELARHGSSIAVYLSAQHVDSMRNELSVFPEDTPIVCAYRVGWPDERLILTTVSRLAETVKEHDLTRHTVFLVLPGERKGAESTVSRLYDAGFSHAYRA